MKKVIYFNDKFGNPRKKIFNSDKSADKFYNKIKNKSKEVKSE